MKEPAPKPAASREDAARLLLAAFAPEAFERVEAARAVARSKIAIEVDARPKVFPVLRRLGFGIPDDQPDDVLVSVVLPEGWELRRDPQDPNGRSTLVLDAAGNVRVLSWFKAAPYDRCGLTDIYNRLSLSEDFRSRPEGNYDVLLRWEVLDNTVRWPDVAVVARFDPTEEENAVFARTRQERDYDAEDIARKAVAARAKAWLAEHYPEHADPLAYWDADVPVIERRQGAS